MQHLIASYLFQNGQCPLPGIGNLSIVSKPSASDFVNRLVTAPTPVIRFTEKETDTAGLLQFISAKTNTNNDTAKKALQSFCDDLGANVADGAAAAIENVGNFTVNSVGEWQFQQQEFPTAFAQSVKAERVIHPEATHSMLVGDKETTTTVMTDYFNEAPAKKDRWWIWAIVLAVLGIMAIIIYYNNPGHSGLFGNAASYKLA